MKKLALLILGTFMTLQSMAQNGKWELEKNESGIKIYTRTVEGEDIREFKAVTTITAPRKKIASIITDINDYPNWYPDIAKASILKKVAANEFIVYSVLDLPWPASDRDGTAKMVISHKTNSTTIKLIGVKGYKEKSDDYVRIPKSYGFWLLTTDGDKTKVHFQYFASPGGSLPDWIINMFIVDNPFETLKLLKDKVK